MTFKIYFELVGGLIGYSIFLYATDWVTALGLFIIIFVNNSVHSVRTIQDVI